MLITVSRLFLAAWTLPIIARGGKIASYVWNCCAQYCDSRISFFYCNIANSKLHCMSTILKRFHTVGVTQQNITLNKTGHQNCSSPTTFALLQWFSKMTPEVCWYNSTSSYPILSALWVIMWINKSDSAPIWGRLILYNHKTYNHRRSQTVCNQVELSTSWTHFGVSITKKVHMQWPRMYQSEWILSVVRLAKQCNTIQTDSSQFMRFRTTVFTMKFSRMYHSQLRSLSVHLITEKYLSGTITHSKWKDVINEKNEFCKGGCK